jgi:hypothetical protein
MGAPTTQSNGQSFAKRCVIFDTNAYRVLTYDLSLEGARAKAVELRQLERQRGSLALAHPIVAWELVYHLVDPSDPAYNRCLNALAALAEHTESADDSDPGICFIADAACSICQDIFDQIPQRHLSFIEHLRQLATSVAKEAPNFSAERIKEDIGELAAWMESEEQSWLSGMEDVRNRLSPATTRDVFGGGSDADSLRKACAFFQSPRFFELWSEHLVEVHAGMVNIAPLTQGELTLKAQRIRENFPAAFHITSALLQKLATNPSLNFQKPKNRNLFWDTLISFSIGPGVLEEDGSVCFVTSDKALVLAAKEAGYSNRVLSLADYLANVGMT